MATSNFGSGRYNPLPVLHLGPILLSSPLILAPMAGVTDRDFRLIVRRLGGVGIVTMEFIASRAILQGNKATRDLMVYAEEERPLSIQIYGSDPHTMAEAARFVEDVGADVCDINMGCPANKVLKGCMGAALMGTLGLAEDIIEAVSKAISIPLTVKFRLGLDDRRQNYIELGKICEDHGVVAVAMHARTAKQAFRGEASWQHIARLKEALDIPVIGNGDVNNPDDALRMFQETGCDAVMIGRGATHNPWIFQQTTARLRGQEPREPSLEERRLLILDHFQRVAAREPSTFALHKLRKFTSWYTHGLPHGRKLRRRIQQLPDVASFLGAVEEFFDSIEDVEVP